MDESARLNGDIWYYNTARRRKGKSAVTVQDQVYSLVGGGANGLLEALLVVPKTFSPSYFLTEACAKSDLGFALGRIASLATVI
jgi:hypothetical protein